MAIQLFSNDLKSALTDFFLYSYLMMDKGRADLSSIELDAIYKTAAQKVLAASHNDSSQEVLMSIINNPSPSGSLVKSLESMLDVALDRPLPNFHSYSTATTEARPNHYPF